MEGVFACGDAALGRRSVANAVFAGNITDAIPHKILVDEEWGVRVLFGLVKLGFNFNNALSTSGYKIVSEC